MQKVHNAKGDFIAIIKEDNSVVIVGKGCQTTIKFVGDKPIIDSQVSKVRFD